MGSMRIFVMNLVIIFVILIAGFLGYYYYNQSTTYVKTNNAQITGQQMTITAPATGRLTDWKGKPGTVYKSGDVIGTVESAAATGGSGSVNVTMPTDGTLVQTGAYSNEIVSPGTPLGYAYNMSNLWVNANIKETELKNVKVGQTVDVYVDAVPNQTFTGTVEQIGLATAGTFSLLPSGNTSGNYTKVTQVVPVKITLSDSQGAGLVPGMSAEVRIHR
ncbi:multidrug resistance protein A [Paenibacillus sp. J31TS4]|uniref:efflux RND transporter periplasmic adaptor subunit n=1 Tax=Paenibacillus sp. J31TS4 TaxID=2807195 RepID=UPI001B0E3970|nr:efflux RND transporter periplasmic adaptor subunit [Paenibacillus sp. J31TS4]GIP36956.1 multidrug resistance protein A [Paenibacillus sp. J31TS4]